MAVKRWLCVELVLFSTILSKISKLCAKFLAQSSIIKTHCSAQHKPRPTVTAAAWSVCLLACVPVCVSVGLCVCLLVSVSVCRSVCLLVCVCLSVGQSQPCALHKRLRWLRCHWGVWTHVDQGTKYKVPGGSPDVLTGRGSFGGKLGHANACPQYSILFTRGQLWCSLWLRNCTNLLLLAAGETCHDTQTTNLKDKYFGFACKTLAVLDGVEEILNADSCVSAI